MIETLTPVVTADFPQSHPGWNQELAGSPPADVPPSTDDDTQAGTTARNSVENEKNRRDSIECLVDEFRKARDKTHDAETKAIAPLINQGRALSKLRRRADRRGEWSRLKKRLRLNARVASRLIRIADWADEIGLIESGLLTRLPFEAHKIEALTRLDAGELGRFLKTHDPREMPRHRVVEEVREALGGPGEDPPLSGAARGREAKIGRSIDRLVGYVKTGVATREQVVNRLMAALDANEAGSQGA